MRGTNGRKLFSARAAEIAIIGGTYGDIGLGVSAVIPRGAFAGNRLSVEWLVPVADDVNGYQLSRVGTLSVTWDTAF